MIGHLILPIVLLAGAIAVFYFTTPARIAAARKRMGVNTPKPLPAFLRYRTARLAFCAGLLLFATIVLAPFLHGLVVVMLLLGIIAIALAAFQSKGQSTAR